MKTCSYCGAEYPDDAARCPIDHTPLDQPIQQSTPKVRLPEYEFAPLSESQKRLDLVTLVSCRTLIEADIIAGRLRTSGIETFLPDEALMQVMGGDQNAFGYVRVQVAPKDYDAAKELLSAG